MRMNPPSRVALIAVGITGAWLLAGCGDFWQNPGATGSATGATASTTTLTSSTTTPTVGAAVTLTATVSPSAATGTVTFYDGTTSVGSGSLNSGTATVSTAFSAAGAQSLTATYGGSTTYSSSTSSVVTVTAAAASSSSAKTPVASTAAAASGANGDNTPTTGNDQAATIRTAGVLNLTGGAYTVQNAESVVVEGSGSVNLADTLLNASAGKDRGILLGSNSADPSSSTTRFTMTGGSITYNCNAMSAPACAQGATASGQNNPATLFSIANTTAAVTLADVTVTNNTSTPTNSEGTLLTAATLNSNKSDTAISGGSHVIFTAQGTALAGNVVVDSAGTVALSLLEDGAGTGASLNGAINSANSGKTVNLTLDQGSTWTVTGTSYLTTLSGLNLNGATVNNIDGGGHCVYYSGAVNGANDAVIYTLSGGGYLAPAGSAGLNCE